MQGTTVFYPDMLLTIEPLRLHQVASPYIFVLYTFALQDQSTGDQDLSRLDYYDKEQES